MVQFEWGPFNIKIKLKFWILVVNQIELLSIPEQSRTTDSFLFLQQYQSTTKLASLWTEDNLLQRVLNGAQQAGFFNIGRVRVAYWIRPEDP